MPKDQESRTLLGSTSFLTLCFFFLFAGFVAKPLTTTTSTPPLLFPRFGISGWRRFASPPQCSLAPFCGAQTGHLALSPFFSWGLRYDAKSGWGIRDCLESQIRFILVREELEIDYHAQSSPGSCQELLCAFDAGLWANHQFPCPH